MVISPRKNLRASLEVPGDKSLTHRALILGALARGRSSIEGGATGQDCASTRRCLEALGASVEDRAEGISIDGSRPLRSAAGSLDCGNSATTMRLLMGALAGASFAARLDGDASLQRRPMERVARPLRTLGAEISTSSDGKPPVAIRGSRLTGARVEGEVASAQVKSAVLLAGLGARGETTYVERTPTRDHTERMLGSFGVPVRSRPEAGSARALSVGGGAELRPARIVVPGDPSSAAFLLVAALITPGSEITVRGVLLNPLRTGFLDVLRRMGADIEWGVERDAPEPVGWIRARSSELSGVRVTAREVPALVDELPILAVAGAVAQGPFEVEGASELRVKESDRISAIGAGIGAMGADFEEAADGFRIAGGRGLRGAGIDARGDHRIAMAFAVAGLAAAGRTEIAGADAAAVSFPGFQERLLSLGEPR